MQEQARLDRNQQRLTECFPTFATKVRMVLTTLERQGFRPRIQDAWRSEADQLKAFNTKHSKVKFGFHNVTGAAGRKESLACDILDDDHPLAPPTRFLLALTLGARAAGLDTLIMMDLSAAQRAKVEAVLASKNIDAKVTVGNDPTHVQPTGITIAQAKAGARPGGAPSAVATAPAAPQGQPSGAAPRIHVVKAGDTLSGIAKKHGITLGRLLELNPRFTKNPNLIRVNDKVTVP